MCSVNFLQNYIPMDENTSQRISFTSLFAITALSFLLFNVAMKIMEGNYSTLFFRIAICSGILSVLCWAGSIVPTGKRNEDTA